MDASSSQASPEVDPPRHLFFGAEDRRLGGRAGLEDKYLVMEKARRHQLSEHVINTANQLASAVRTLRAFDRTGNADMALDHIEQTFADLKKHTDNLVNEVTGSVDRYGDEVEKLAFRDIAAAREATDAQTPTPRRAAGALLGADPVADLVVDVEKGIISSDEIRRVTPLLIARASAGGYQ